MAGLITTTGSGNWSSTTPDAPWPGGTKPATGDWIEIAAGHTVTLDENTPTLGAAGIKNVAGSNTSVLDISGTRTINGCVSYSGTSTSGFITLGTGDDLTINYGGGAGTNAVTQSGTGGYCIVGSGTGVLSISNSGGTAVLCSASGRAVSWASTGNLTVTGAVTATTNASARGLNITAAATVSVTGDVTSSSGVGINAAAGTTTIDGQLNNGTSTGNVTVISIAGGSVTWSSASTRTIAAGDYCHISMDSGSFVISNVTLQVSGVFVLRRIGGTLTATSTTIQLRTATAQAAILGQAVTVTGASIPSAADTRYGVTRGWADGGTGATAGCGVAGGNGLLEMPNEGAPTGTEDATSDALVKLNAHYGSTPRHGSLAGGGVIVIDD